MFSWQKDQGPKLPCLIHIIPTQAFPPPSPHQKIKKEQERKKKKREREVEREKDIPQRIKAFYLIICNYFTWTKTWDMDMTQQNTNIVSELFANHNDSLTTCL